MTNYQLVSLVGQSKLTKHNQAILFSVHKEGPPYRPVGISLFFDANTARHGTCPRIRTETTLGLSQFPLPVGVDRHIVYSIIAFRGSGPSSQHHEENLSFTKE